MTIRIGVAGWSLRRDQQSLFDAGTSHLARYATRLNAVEINSSFYRPHRRVTYERWAAATPEDFRFSVKLPRPITHLAKLVDPDAMLDVFAAEVLGLGAKLGPLLTQLPPSLAFDAVVAERFLRALRARFSGELACEPRHASWFDAEADALLKKHGAARVAADPPPVPDAARPGGWQGFRYFRWHGSPVMYRSAYGPERLKLLTSELKAGDWCILDNTAEGAALPDALQLRAWLANRLF